MINWVRINIVIEFIFLMLSLLENSITVYFNYHYANYDEKSRQSNNFEMKYLINKAM